MYDTKKFRSAQNVTDVSFFVVKMASHRDSNLIPLLPGMLSCVGLPHSKTLSTPPQRQLSMPESLMTKTMLLPRLQLRLESTLHQVLLHHRTSVTTLQLHLLLMGTSRGSMSSNFLVLTDKRGRSIWVDSLQAGPYGWLLYFCQVFTTLAFDTFGFLSCNT